MLASMPTLLAGNYSLLAQWAVRDRAPRPLNLMNLAMDCASYASPARLQRIRAEAPTTRLGDAINGPLPLVCEAPELPRLPESYRASTPSNVMALLIAGEFDGRTPEANAREVAATMPHARVLLVKDVSHDVFGAAEVSAALVAFLGGAR
jgi:pimeloyl-ACP methyl ester carboxylesterase